MGFIQTAYAQATRVDLCPQGQFRSVCGASTQANNIIGQVITVVFVIAIILALAFIIYGGIRWIASGGDKTKVEEARGTLVAAIIGIVLIFLSYIILNFVLSLFGVSLTNLKIPPIFSNSPAPTPTPTPKVIVATPTPTPMPDPSPTPSPMPIIIVITPTPTE